MPRGKPAPKLAITVDPDVYEGVLAAAAADGVSVSAWMTNAARMALIRSRGLAAIAEYEREHAPFTEEEVSEADRRIDEMLGVAPRRRTA